jgi:hypothetical protein
MRSDSTMPMVSPRHADVEDAEQETGADQPDVRHQQQREQDGGDQRADVVHGQHARHQLAQFELPLQQPQQDGYLEPDQHAHQSDDSIQRHAELRHMRKQQEQDGGRRTTHHADHDLDAHEVVEQPLAHIARQPRPDAHGEQVSTDDRRELRDRIAQQVAGERTRHQLVHQSAARDDERGEQQQRAH